MRGWFRDFRDETVACCICEDSLSCLYAAYQAHRDVSWCDYTSCYPRNSGYASARCEDWEYKQQRAYTEMRRSEYAMSACASELEALHKTVVSEVNLLFTELKDQLAKLQQAFKAEVDYAIAAMKLCCLENHYFDPGSLAYRIQQSCDPTYPDWLRLFKYSIEGRVGMIREAVKASFEVSLPGLAHLARKPAESTETGKQEMTQMQLLHQQLEKSRRLASEAETRWATADKAKRRVDCEVEQLRHLLGPKKAQVTIKTMTGFSFPIEVDLLDTVKSVKKQLCKLEGTPVELQSLKLPHGESTNSDLLASCQVENGAVIHLMIRLC